MATLTESDLHRVASAFGFEDPKAELAAGPPVIVPKNGKAFCTVTPDVPWFEVPSYPALTDGRHEKGQKIPGEWVWHSGGLYVYPFTFPEASFIATEFNGLPEHVFLFPDAPNFDLDLIIDKLTEHRTKNPSLGFTDDDPYTERRAV